MAGFRVADAGRGAKNPRATARSWAKTLLSRLMDAEPDANEFCVRLIPKPDKTIDVEVTLGGTDSA